MSFITENWMAIVVALLAISEVLALIPSIQSNSIFQLIYNALKGIVKKDEPK